MTNGLEDVVEHEVRCWDDVALAIGRVVREVGRLHDKTLSETQTNLTVMSLTQSGNPRIRRASQMDAAASNDGGAAMRRHSRH